MPTKEHERAQEMKGPFAEAVPENYRRGAKNAEKSSPFAFSVFFAPLRFFPTYPLAAVRLSCVRSCFSVTIAIFIGGCFGAAQELPARFKQDSLPKLDEVLGSKLDLWGDAAMRQPNGASYEFFEPLLPPLRYVNADFHFYPLVLCAPTVKVKARLISNGSGINLRGGARSWNDPGTPVIFRVGPDEFKFGKVFNRLQHPVLAEGYLPIPKIRYAHASEVYEVEAFASTDPGLAEQGVVFAKFALANGTNGLMTVQADASPIKFSEGVITDSNGQPLVVFDGAWTWERQGAHARIATNKFATLAIVTEPAAEKDERLKPAALGPLNYEQQRKLCAQTWNGLLQRGMQVAVPEDYVNNAWRQLIIQNFSLMHSNRIHYSAGNQYDKLYETEGSDAAMALMLWGYEADTRRLIPPLLDFTREAIQFNQAGHKLEDVARYYWQTRDGEFIKALRPKWEKEINRILDSRGDNGLVARDHYCNDIPTPVFSLNSNGKCWRGLRDLSTALADMGEKDEAQRLGKIAAQFRQAILAAVEKSTFTNTEPPFIPVALFGEEQPYDPLCATKMGSYWNLMVNFLLGFEVLGPGSEREDWLLHYIQQHGGLCMGMERCRPNPTFWIGTQGLNPLYGTRYALTLLRRDEPERALVTFYGMLAQGFTRNTFIAGEGNSLTPLDELGRQFYCPPNSAGNGHFLQMLRNLLVQDWDLDDDGVPETLRLLFATPKRWLEDGKTITVERAPTAFGLVSITAQSKLSQGEIIAEIDLPRRNKPRQTLFRVRVPDGWRVTSAEAETQRLPVDERGTVDISALKGKVSIRFKVTKS